MTRRKEAARMADKYISVEAMRKRLGIDKDGNCKKCQYGGGIGACMKPVYVEYICGELDKEPAADVRPVVRGVWEPGETIFFCGAEHTAPRTCSVCGRSASDEPWYFCPNCGADMRLKPETEMRCNHENGNVSRLRQADPLDLQDAV